MIAINYPRIQQIRGLLNKLPKIHSENTLSYYDSIVGNSDSDIFHIRKPAKKRKGKRGMPTLVEQIWAYLRERFTKSPTDKRIHRAIVEHSTFRRDATISIEIEHGGNVQEFSFPPSTSIQTFRKISLALRRDFAEGLKMYQEFCRYDGMGGR